MRSVPRPDNFNFAQAVIRWQEVHGRHSLPWQSTRDPYCIWLSEIMLQQTQVVTVLGYYSRFLERFPSVFELAASEEADVLALWSGMGYYSRARYLHKCAQAVVTWHGGQFPTTASELETLPGIGPSTAAAIASFCYGEPVSIFDGNVKRVLARFTGFESDLSMSGADKALRQLANSLLPTGELLPDMPRYTQGLMDLGATVCTPSKPACLQCPLVLACQAHRAGNPARLPIKTRRQVRRTFAWHLLILQQPCGRVWLEKRPARGIWASLYCPPVFDSDNELMTCAAVTQATPVVRLDSFNHALTHCDIVLHPVVQQVPAGFNTLAVFPDRAEGRWVAPDQVAHIGLAAPVSKLLVQLQVRP
jgi:A/G-specific adenine glycosylase